VLPSEQYALSKVTTARSAVRQAIVLPLVYCSVDDTLFEVSPEIHFFRGVTLPLLLSKKRSSRSWF